MSDRTTNPVHHHSPSLSGTSLQIPQTQRSQSTISSQRSFNQSKSRVSTRQSQLSSTSSSNWTSVSAISGASQSSGANRSFYPTSGFPNTNSFPGQTYPSSGYPVSQLLHSYGYPSNNFPCCEIPGVVDMKQQLQYPSSEFPGGGVFPGEVEQDDGCQPFIGASMDSTGSGVYPSDPLAAVAGGSGGFPSGQISYASTDMMTLPTAFDPRYNLGFPS